MNACVVSRLSSGDYIMGGSVGGGDLLVYGPGGGRLTRVIGRPGQGPGEFGTGRPLETLIVPGDTIYVHDSGNRRITALSASGEVIRSFQVGYRVSGMALLDDGTFLVHPSTSRPTGPLFEAFDRMGNPLWRTGMPANEIDSWGISAPPGDGFWAFPLLRYEVQHRTPRGDVDVTLRRELPWFPDGPVDTEAYNRDPRVPYFIPFLRHVWQDDRGRLWTYSQLPDTTAQVGETISPTERLRRTSDTWIEVIDPRRARVIATGRYDYRLEAVCESHLMFAVVETPLGDTRVRVLEPLLIEGR